jgi:DNA polymerase III subunit epsilon
MASLCGDVAACGVPCRFRPGRPRAREPCVRRRWLDVAFLVPALFPQPAQTLDDWLRVFGIEAYARHDALADALATAQLFQIVLAEAARRGLRTLGALRGLQRDQRTLARY